MEKLDFLYQNSQTIRYWKKNPICNTARLCGGGWMWRNLSNYIFELWTGFPSPPFLLIQTDHEQKKQKNHKSSWKSMKERKMANHLIIPARKHGLNWTPTTQLFHRERFTFPASPPSSSAPLHSALFSSLKDLLGSATSIAKISFFSVFLC